MFADSFLPECGEFGWLPEGGQSGWVDAAAWPSAGVEVGSVRGDFFGLPGRRMARPEHLRGTRHRSEPAAEIGGQRLASSSAGRQPVVPHRMTRGGSFTPRISITSLSPSVAIASAAVADPCRRVTPFLILRLKHGGRRRRANPRDESAKAIRSRHKRPFPRSPTRLATSNPSPCPTVQSARPERSSEWKELGSRSDPEELAPQTNPFAWSSFTSRAGLARRCGMRAGGRASESRAS